MKKDKTRHFETFLGQSYPQKLPAVGKLGKLTLTMGFLVKTSVGLKVRSRMLKTINNHRLMRFGSGWAILTENDFRIVE